MFMSQVAVAGVPAAFFDRLKGAESAAVEKLYNSMIISLIYIKAQFNRIMPQEQMYVFLRKN